MIETTAIQKTENRNKRLRNGILIGDAVVMTIFLIAVLCLNFFNTHAAPGTYLSGVSVSLKSVDEIINIAEQRFLQSKLELSLSEPVFANGTDLGAGTNNSPTSVTRSPQELGLSIDKEHTVRAVLSDGEYSVFSKINPFIRKDVKVVLTGNPDTLSENLARAFPGAFAAVNEPSVKYNKRAGKFKVKEGMSGKVIDSSHLMADLQQKVLSNRTEQIKIESKAEIPRNTTEDAKAAAKQLNAMLKSDIRFVYEGQTLYTVPKAVLATWMSASASAIDGKLAAAVDTEKIQAFLDEKLPEHIDRSVTDEIVLTNKKNEVKVTLQKGEDGRSVTGTSGFAEKIAAAVSENQEIKLEPEFTFPKYERKNVKETGENWVEVNLTNQKVMLWTGDKKLKTFTVSTGKPATPTVTGTYKIYMRRDDHTMIGGDKRKGTYYAQPHVRYISYFHRGYAFHAAYWHNAFGRVISHGCVNMRTPEAKILYDFAPIGTRVVVHY